MLSLSSSIIVIEYPLTGYILIVSPKLFAINLLLTPAQTTIPS